MRDLSLKDLGWQDFILVKCMVGMVALDYEFGARSLW